MIMNHPPHDLVIKHGVTVDKNITEGYDPPRLWNLTGRLWRHL